MGSRIIVEEPLPESDLVAVPAKVKLPNLWEPLLRVTDLHPSYRDVFARTTYTLLYGVGNLTPCTRHFIAIMAATRHRCDFLVDLHTREFERLGGDVQWLRGLAYMEDSKIKSLDRLNMLLAHQPWLCKPEYISELVGGSDHWSLTDLVHATSVMCHTHSLSSFIHAVGTIEPMAVSESEQKQVVATPFEWSGSARDKENVEKRKGEVEELLRCMEKLRASANGDSTTSKHNETFFNSLANGSNDEGSGSESPDRSCDSPVFSNQLTFAYVDFALRTDSTKTFKSHEFTWEHGFSILEDISKDLAVSLDNKFKATQAMTYGFMGGYEDVDTTGYRTAIWNYIQALFGIRHDDYNYQAVNQLLSRDMKTFVKTVACFPHKLTDQLRSAVMVEFKPSEKVHVVMMIMEARLQASMLWFTRTLTNYYAQTSRAQSTRQLD